jgi:hypothetical protein
VEPYRSAETFGISADYCLTPAAENFVKKMSDVPASLVFATPSKSPVVVPEMKTEPCEST